MTSHPTFENLIKQCEYDNKKVSDLADFLHNWHTLIEFLKFNKPIDKEKEKEKNG